MGIKGIQMSSSDTGDYATELSNKKRRDPIIGIEAINSDERVDECKCW